VTFLHFPDLDRQLELRAKTPVLRPVSDMPWPSEPMIAVMSLVIAGRREMARE
jgi:hypothetical protein